MSAKAIRDQHAWEETMKSLIIYDDFASASKVKATLARAAQRAGRRMRGNVELCRLGLLKQPALAAKVLGEAIDAHFIVVALSHSESLPASLLDWLENWAVRRWVQDAALAVFDDGEGGTLSVLAMHELWQFTMRHGLSFIFDDGKAAIDESDFFAHNLPWRKARRTPTLLDLLDEPIHEPYRNWGLNE